MFVIDRKTMERLHSAICNGIFCCQSGARILTYYSYAAVLRAAFPKNILIAAGYARALMNILNIPWLATRQNKGGSLRGRGVALPLKLSTWVHTTWTILFNFHQDSFR